MDQATLRYQHDMDQKYDNMKMGSETNICQLGKGSEEEKNGKIVAFCQTPLELPPGWAFFPKKKKLPITF